MNALYKDEINSLYDINKELLRIEKQFVDSAMSFFENKDFERDYATYKKIMSFLKRLYYMSIEKADKMNIYLEEICTNNEECYKKDIQNQIEMCLLGQKILMKKITKKIVVCLRYYREYVKEFRKIREKYRAKLKKTEEKINEIIQKLKQMNDGLINIQEIEPKK